MTQKDSFQSSFSENFIFLIEFLSQQDLLVYKNCIETLLTILQNILKSSEEKFRKIKKTNPNFFAKVGKHPLALKFLSSVGFDETEEFLIMKSENPTVLQESCKELENVLENLNLPKFNPYEAVFTSTNSENAKILSRENDPFAINLEIKKVNSIEFPSVNRQPAIYKVENPSNLQNFNFQDFDEEKEDEISQLANIQAVMREKEEFSKFRNKRKIELNKLKDSQVAAVLIKIRFPDKFVLQGLFSAKETAKDVYFFVRENLIERNREFYLYETPPRKIIKNGNHSLKPFAPATLIYFAWSDLDETTELNGPFLVHP